MKRFILFLLLAIPSVAMLAQQQESTSFTIDTISDQLFARMWKKSYKADCTIPRSDLRYLRVLHVDAQGKTHEGEIVCNKKIAKDLIDIFRQLYKARYPIERIRLVDEYDADDELSMRDNNTSCFNFRTVPGRTKLSKHAQGLAIDINTRYNPYVRPGKNGTTEVMPANARPYVNRSRSFAYKIKQGDLLHRLFIQHGFTWGGAWRSSKDYQHFEK